MFERFTEEAREVVVRAQHEADTLGHDYLGTEHLLLGLASDDGAAGRRSAPWACPGRAARAARGRVRVRRSADADALATIGIDLDEVRSRVEEAFGPGALERTRAGRRRFCRARPFGPFAKRALELSLREALSAATAASAASTSCSASCAPGEGPAVKLLEQRGLPPEAVRAAVLRELNRG